MTAAALVFAAVSREAIACSLARLMTLHELFTGSQWVVCARPVGYLASPPSRGRLGTVEFLVLEILKGTGIPDRLPLEGFLEDKDDFNDHAVPYSFVRPGGRHGNCVASNYKQGAEYLLFLRGYRGRVFPYGALTPANEQLRSGNDPWLAWARNYLAAMAHNLDPNTPVRRLSWTTEVRPLLESVVTVRAQRRMGTHGKPFSAEIENPHPRDDPFIADPLLEELAALAVTRGDFLRSDSAANYLKQHQERGDKAIPELLEIERNYRALFLADSNILRRLMPTIHQLFSHRRAACPDCPGPTQFSATSSFTKRELLVSVARRASPAYERDQDGVPPPLSESEFLAREAALQIAKEGEAAAERFTQMRDTLRSKLSFQKDQDERARNEVLRNRLVALLENDREFLMAIQPILRRLREIGGVCSDCEEGLGSGNRPT